MAADHEEMTSKMIIAMKTQSRTFSSVPIVTVVQLFVYGICVCCTLKIANGLS